MSKDDTMIIQGSAKKMAEKAASILYDTTIRLLREKKKVVIAVPGGRSVAGVYEKFRHCALPWDRVHIFLLDERLVAADHPDSNYKLIREYMVNKAGSVLIHPFMYDVKHPMQSIIDYKEELNRCGGRLDIVLASSGEDGHIGSLFPNHPSLKKNQDGFFLLDDSPKPPAERMAASFELIRQADTGIVLFFGNSKREALRRFQNTQLSYKECPARIMIQLPHYYLLTDLEVNAL